MYNILKNFLIYKDIKLASVGTDICRRTIRIFSYNRSIRFEWFRFALVINGFHPELIFMSFLQTLDVHFGIGSSANWDPATRILVEFFNRITSDGFSSIIFWFLPFDFTAVLGNIFDFEWTLGFSRGSFKSKPLLIW